MKPTAPSITDPRHLETAKAGLGRGSGRMTDFDSLTLSGAAMPGGLRYHRGDEAKVLADAIAFWRACWGEEPSAETLREMRRDLAAARAVSEKERGATPPQR